MKVAVYTICKNEAKHINRFMDACEGADEVVILDTGSVDNSVQLLQKRGAVVHEAIIDPWRFDEARNLNLSHVSNDIDICACIDLDEILLPGWRQELDGNWCVGVTRVNYWYCQGDSGDYYRHHKIHSRKGYFWRHPVHEELCTLDPENICWTDIKVNHYPDNTKPRSNYYPLLLQAVYECPNQPRFYMYLMIECMAAGRYEETFKWGEKSLDLEDWEIHRSRICALIADCYQELDDESEEYWRSRAAIEAPQWREPWFHLAQYYTRSGKRHRAYSAAMTAIGLHERQWINYSDINAWSGEMYRVAAIAAVNVDNRDLADMIFSDGITAHPNDSKLARDYGEFLS